MSQLDTNKLTVEFRDGVTYTEPIIPRLYTLTHSDITADLYLTIGTDFAYDKINAIRDEVLGEWVSDKSENYFFQVYLYVNGKSDWNKPAMRNAIFRSELPLALEAIRYGDQALFTHEELDAAPIIVYFQSEIPEFNVTENWGTFSNYKNRGTIK